MRKLFYLLAIFTNLNLFAQVGIGKAQGISTLDIKGSLSGKAKEVSTNTLLSINDFYIVYSNNTTSAHNHSITLPNLPTNRAASIKGRVYQIKNVSAFPLIIKPYNSSQTLRIGNSNGATSFSLPAGSYTEIINTGNATTNAWELMFVTNPITTKQSNVTIYSAKLIIPPMNILSSEGGGGVADWTNSNPTFNAANNIKDSYGYYWTIVSKSSVPFRRETESYWGNDFMVGYVNNSMELVYEYTGPAFDASKLSSMHPILTTGNTSNAYPDVFVPSFYRITNVNGKTRISIKVTRVDKIGYQKDNTSTDEPTGTGSTSKWTGTFMINLVIATKQ